MGFELKEKGSEVSEAPLFDPVATEVKLLQIFHNITMHM